MGTGTTAVGTYNLSGGTISANTPVVVGDLGNGTFNQTGGSNTMSGIGHWLYLARETGSVGHYTLSAGNLSNGELETIGYKGTGTFDQSGGTNSAVAVSLGGQPAGTGTYSLTSTGRLTVSSTISVGDLGNGSFTQDGTSIITSDKLFIGLSSGVTGSFTQNAGTNTVNQLRIGTASTAQGTYTLNGGTLQTNLVEWIGDGGTGSFSQMGGSHIAADLNVNGGTYTFTAGTLTASNEYVGQSGAAGFTQSGGTNTTGVLLLGNNQSLTTPTGTYTLSGGTLVTTSSEYIGINSTGTLMQSGGAHSSLGDISIGYNAGSNGTYTISGGTANAVNVYVGGRSNGAGGTGVLTVSGSSTILNVSNSICVYNTANSVFNLQGGTVNVGAINVNGVPSRFNWSSGTLNITNDLALDSACRADFHIGGIRFVVVVWSSTILKVAGNETIGGTGTFSLTLSSS